MDVSTAPQADPLLDDLYWRVPGFVLPHAAGWLRIVTGLAALLLLPVPGLAVWGAALVGRHVPPPLLAVAVAVAVAVGLSLAVALSSPAADTQPEEAEEKGTHRTSALLHSVFGLG